MPRWLVVDHHFRAQSQARGWLGGARVWSGGGGSLVCLRLLSQSETRSVPHLAANTCTSPYTCACVCILRVRSGCAPRCRCLPSCRTWRRACARCRPRLGRGRWRRCRRSWRAAPGACVWVCVCVCGGCKHQPKLNQNQRKRGGLGRWGRRTSLHGGSLSSRCDSWCQGRTRRGASRLNHNGQ